MLVLNNILNTRYWMLHIEQFVSWRTIHEFLDLCRKGWTFIALLLVRLVMDILSIASCIVHEVVGQSLLTAERVTCLSSDNSFVVPWS